MAITQRKIQKTGGGSSASAVGVQQIATPKSNIGSNVQSLAKSLGVIMDTSLSDHQQQKVDQASADEFNKVRKATAGMSQEEKEIAFRDHRERLREANPKGMIDTMLGKDDTKLRRYDELNAQQLVNHTLRSSSKLQANFSADDDWDARQGKIDALFLKVNADADSMSPEVAELYQQAVTGSYHQTLNNARTKYDAKLGKDNERLVSTTASDMALMQHDQDLLSLSSTSLKGYKAWQESLTLRDETGEPLGIKPEILKSDYATIQQMGKDLKDMAPHVSNSERGKMKLQKAREIATAKQSPELYEELVGMIDPTIKKSWRDLYPQEVASTLQELRKVQGSTISRLEAQENKGKSVAGSQQSARIIADYSNRLQDLDKPDNTDTARAMFDDLQAEKDSARAMYEDDVLSAEAYVGLTRTIEATKAMSFKTVANNLTPSVDAELQQYLIQGGDRAGMVNFQFASNSAKRQADSWFKVSEDQSATINTKRMKTVDESTNRYVEDHITKIKDSTKRSTTATSADVLPFNYDAYGAQIKDLYQSRQLDWVQDPANTGKILDATTNARIHKEIRPEVDQLLVQMDEDAKLYAKQAKEDEDAYYKQVKLDVENARPRGDEPKVEDNTPKDFTDMVIQGLQGVTDIDTLDEAMVNSLSEAVSLDTKDPSFYSFMNVAINSIDKSRFSDPSAVTSELIHSSMTAFANSVEANRKELGEETYNMLTEQIDLATLDATGDVSPEAIRRILSGEFMNEKSLLTNDTGGKNYKKFIELESQ